MPFQFDMCLNTNYPDIGILKIIRMKIQVKTVSGQNMGSGVNAQKHVVEADRSGEDDVHCLCSLFESFLFMGSTLSSFQQKLK